MNSYKQGLFFSYDFVGENSWNGYENNLLFANLGDGKFADIARPAGCDGIKDGRGVAVTDLNGDGQLDLVINNNNAAPTVYLNHLATGRNWLELELVGRDGNRNAIGARVVLTAAGKRMTRLVEAGSGYASQSMFPVHFGLGTADLVEGLEIHWPGGHVDRYDGASFTSAVGLNRRVRIEEGAGLGEFAAVLRGAH